MQRCALPAEHVTAMLAPIALTIWIAAVPTPDAPAWTSAQRPLVRPPCSDEGVPRREEDLGDGGGVAPVEPGRDGHRLAGVGGEQLGVAAAALDAHHRVADRPLRDTRPTRRHRPGVLEAGDLAAPGRRGSA